MGLIFDTWTIENASEWLLDKLATNTNENLIKIAIVLLGIWFARNQRLWENKVVTPCIAMAWSSKQVMEWSEANKNKLQRGMKNSNGADQHKKKWSPPTEGILKLNVDASVFSDAEFFSIGMVIRDCKGQFIRGKVMKIVDRVPVEEAEMTGILEALLWLAEFPEHQVIIESDSLICVNAVNSMKQNLLEMGDLVEQCREFYHLRTGTSIVFTRKQANQVAHSLARLPCTPNGFSILSSPPSCLLETLMSDCLVN